MKLEKSVAYLTIFALIGIIAVGLVVLFVHEKDMAKRASEIKPSAAPTPTPDPTLLHVKNEASENCVTKGGALRIEKNRQGKEFGVCVFPAKDGVEGVCEEWALYKGKCPNGGLRIKSKVSDVVRYCVIAGGEYVGGMIDDQGNDKGKCYFYPKTECDIYDFFSGACKPVELQ